MNIRRDELILIQLLSLDLPGKELLTAAHKVINQVLELYRYRLVSLDELYSIILEVYQERSGIILKTRAFNDGYDPNCIQRVRATWFSGHILTHVLINTELVGRWEFRDYIWSLPWIENFLVIDSGTNKFTKDDVLEMDFVQDYKESITKVDVDNIMRFLNGGRN